MMPGLIENKYIALGVSGSIACHKSVDLASKLVQDGALVDVILTKSALSFVTPIAFEAITHRPVTTGLFDSSSDSTINHVSIAERSDVIVLAPSTANTIAKISLGLADDPLTTTVLAANAPVIVCPAMDGQMYENPATQENINRLISRGYTIVGPVDGYLASGQTGKGRMTEPSNILGHIRYILGQKGDLVGRKIVVSAGGTKEPMDPVRFIGNRSSGKMGYAVANAARDRGAETVLVSTSNSLSGPVGVKVIKVENASSMKLAIEKECRDADVLIMAAAVADWRPNSIHDQKLKKNSNESMDIQLVPTEDILAEIEFDGLVKVGFAAESEDLESNARIKLDRKNLDFIAANDILSDESGFETDTNRIVILDRNGGVERLGLLSKYDVGWHILDRVVSILK